MQQQRGFFSVVAVKNSLTSGSLQSRSKKYLCVAACMAAGMMLPGVSNAASLASDPFNYANTTISGANGGTGWSGGWYTSSDSFGYLHRVDPGNVTSTSLPQNASGGSLLIAAGYGGPADMYVGRNFSTFYGGPGNTVWGSFTYTDSQEGNYPLQLYLQEAGVRNLLAPQNTPYFVPNSGSFPNNDGHDTPGNFCLFEVVGGANSFTANFYINPNLSTFDPATTTPTATVGSIPETTGFNAIVFGLSNDGSGNQTSVDEFRLGTSVSDVANYVASTGPATLVYNNAGGNNTWDVGTTANWNKSGSNTVYSDTSNTAASPVTGDNVRFDDSVSSNPNNYNVIIAANVHPTSVTFANTSGNYNISGSGVGIAGPTSVVLTGGGTVTLASSNTYTGGTNVSAGKLVLASATAFPSNGSAGTALTIAANAVVQIAPHTTGASYQPVVSSLSNGGLIDITNNQILFTGSSLAVINGEVAAAYNAATGAWSTSGNGLITSSTVGGLTTVGVATVTGGVAAKATYYGDANLDGQVTSADYTLIDNGFLTNATGWQNGDFNYDNVINGSDYTLIDNAFNTQGAQLSAEIASSSAQIAGSGITSAVPEPTSLGLLGLGVIGWLGRRRQR